MGEFDGGKVAEFLSAFAENERQDHQWGMGAETGRRQAVVPEGGKQHSDAWEGCVVTMTLKGDRSAWLCCLRAGTEMAESWAYLAR